MSLPRLRTSPLVLAFLLAVLAWPVLADETAATPATPAPADADAAAAPPTDPAKPGEELPSFFATTTVTAVGREVDTFEVATPVTVISTQEIERRAPNNAADLLREQPGVDVNGVGPNQARPVIRGQRGLRVLFLEDGLRMNNARRQTDFGEITGLVDLDTVSSVEVVRGPASVLYGSDAIGGVLNLVTKLPSSLSSSPIGGGAELRYGTAAEQKRASLSLAGGIGRFSYMVNGSKREASDYDAPAGRFGQIHLTDSVPVLDSGVDDHNLFARLGWNLTDSQTLGLRHSTYHADQTGFGYMDPALIGGDTSALVRILYPYQDFDRTTLSYDNSALSSVVADSFQLRGYYQVNERELVNDIDINIGPIFPGAPDSSVAADSTNYTKLKTAGVRAEAIKVAGTRQVLTYGFEYYRDDSFNTDFSTTTTNIRFPFPPFLAKSVTTDGIANSPNAINESWGVFAQDEITLAEKIKLSAGARYQDVATRAKSTPGWDIANLDFTDDAFVGAATLTYQVTDYLNLLGSYGRAFRAPNIIERLFNGPTPEGSGFQILNSDLTSETSDNYDLGMKYRRQNAFFEAVFFHNEIKDGIIQDFLAPEEIAALPAALQARITSSGARFVVQERNVDRLRYEGLELALGYRHTSGLTVGGNYTHITGKRVTQSAAPVEDQYSDKIAAYLRYEQPKGRFWAEYRVRHNGSEKVNIEPGEPLPAVGATLPAFTIHTLSGGVTLYEHGRFGHVLQLTIENLTDELYAEFSNASFFRPEMGRNVVASYRLRF